MKIYISILLMVNFFFIEGMASNIYEQLDSAIAVSPQAVLNKEKNINQLYKIYLDSDNPYLQIEMLDRLYREYITYQNDSALVYADRMHMLADKLGDKEYMALAKIRKALLKVRGGYYTEASLSLDSISLEDCSNSTKKEFHESGFWLNLYLSNYTHDEELKHNYIQEMKEHVAKAADFASKGTLDGDYLMAEKIKITDNDYDSAVIHYKRIVDKAPLTSKIYASSAFSIADYYRVKGDLDSCKIWMIKAAIADRLTPLKENVAIREIALMILDEEHADIERAMRYLTIASEDAVFYGDNLRLLEIARKFPGVSDVFIRDIRSQSRNILFGALFLAFLVVMLVIAMMYIRRQHKALSVRNRELSESRNNLECLNKKLNRSISDIQIANSKLEETNKRLHEVNKRREWLAKISFGLCARTIESLHSYSSLVRRKIRAHQEKDLLESGFASHISDDEVATFIAKFDKAFLDLYPDFVDQLNKLFRPDAQIVVKQPNSLNTELRICALIRLGIKESSEIASLLFSSAQTVYNNRANTRKRAIDKDNFQANLENLCK